MGPLFYALLASRFGTLAIAWQQAETGAKVHQIFLPDERTRVEHLVQATFSSASPLSCPAVAEIAGRIHSFLDGEATEFDLDVLALERCSAFQRKVLLAEHGIPRGWVSTYGGIARSVGTPRGARAVGSALARNPFPIMIPCHRAIRSNGEVGGFQGGSEMKRALLELEGVEFSRSGKVVMKRVYY